MFSLEPQFGRRQKLAAKADRWEFPRYCHYVGLAAGTVMLAVVLIAPTALLSGTPQQKQKNNKKDADSTSLASLVPLPDAQAVDLVISQMLGAWQVGNLEMLHKSYADDVMVVSASWEPPVAGWENYSKAFQAQYARTNGGRMERSNSIIKVTGDNAWATYQWQFSGQVDGNPASGLGHTTLVLLKRAGVWVIVLNHTSAVPTAQATVATPQAATPQQLAPRKSP